MPGTAIPANPNHSRLVKDVLEGTLRMQASRSLESRIEAAVDFMRLVADGCRALVLARNGSGLVICAKGHADFDAGSGAIFDHARKLALKSHDDGITLVDPTARGMGYALPVMVENRTCAAVFVASDSTVRRLDASDLDAIRAATDAIGQTFGTHRNGVVPEKVDPLHELLSESPPDSEGCHSLRMAKHAFEKRLLRTRLIECQGNIAAAARTLKMDRGQLSRLLKKYKVDKSGFRSDTTA